MKKALHMLASQFFSLTTDKHVIFFDVYCLRCMLSRIFYLILHPKNIKGYFKTT